MAYNALAILTGSAYQKMTRMKSEHGTWEKALEAEGATGNPESSFAKLERAGIALILRDNPDYPPLLGEIPHPPHGLYVKGTMPGKGDIGIAVVGTRKATSDGKEFARRLASELAEAELVITSGLAFGIDAAAHAGCLEAGGKTLAVLGSGLKNIYPRTNSALAENILSGGGALISEYPPDTPPRDYRFLERNRVVSGLSRAVLVIEAPQKSGVMATARFAVEQNRDVFVVPGPARHPNFRGSHALLRSGAVLVTSSTDILEDMNMASPETGSGFSDYADEANRIMETISGAARSLSIDEIIQRTTLEAARVRENLTFLILDGKVKEEGDGYAV